MKTQREAIASALVEHREAWDLQSDAPQDWLDQVEGDLIHRLDKATYPTELLEAFQYYVTFHQGHALPPELVYAQREARAALALYEPEEGER